METALLLQRINDLFYYDNGKLLNKGSRCRVAGKESGWIRENGYKMVSIGGKHYREHRIIFAMHYNYFPLLIDHIDQNKLNNNIKNLRDATRSLNGLNAKLRITNKSGKCGIFFDKNRNKWRAYIKIDKTYIHGGRFDSKEEAIVARLNLERKYGQFV